MAYIHCQTRAPIPTTIWTPNLMATLYCTETVPIDSESDTDLDPRSPAFIYTGADAKAKAKATSLPLGSWRMLLSVYIKVTGTATKITEKIRFRSSINLPLLYPFMG